MGEVIQIDKKRRTFMGSIDIYGKTKNYHINVRTHSRYRYLVEIVIYSKRRKKGYIKVRQIPIPQKVRRWLDNEEFDKVKAWVHERLKAALRDARKVKKFTLGEPYF